MAIGTTYTFLILTLLRRDLDPFPGLIWAAPKLISVVVLRSPVQQRDTGWYFEFASSRPLTRWSWELLSMSLGCAGQRGIDQAPHIKLFGPRQRAKDRVASLPLGRSSRNSQLRRLTPVWILWLVSLASLVTYNCLSGRLATLEFIAKSAPSVSDPQLATGGPVLTSMGAIFE
jgi:hypothetical protein